MKPYPKAALVREAVHEGVIALVRARLEKARSV
jgi:hypothetical protein